MTILFLLLTFAMGAGFGIMLCAGVMLAMAVNKTSEAKGETLFEGRHK